MSVSYNPSFVTNGLVNHYDFANVKSYPGSGSTWTDLVGTTNLTINGTPTYNSNGFITFATDQTTQFIGNASFPMPTGDNTLSVWFRIAAGATSANFTPISYNVVGNDNNILLFLSSTSIGPQTLGDGSWGASTPTDMRGVWVNLVWTRIQSTGVEVLYYNGSQLSTITRAVGQARSAPGYLVLGQESDSPGGGFDPNQNLDGDMASFSVYNRAITAAEAAQNFNAYRGRFGI